MKKLKYFKYIIKAIIPLLFIIASTIFAKGIKIGTGAKLNIRKATLTVPSDITINGTLEASTGTINVGGNWNNSGTFIPGTGTVKFVDSKSPVNILGQSQFYNFQALTNTGKQINFETTAAQDIINSIKLTGAPDNLLFLRSTLSGKQAKINLYALGTEDINYIDVKDHYAAGKVIAYGNPSSFNSIDSGNNSQWFLNSLFLDNDKDNLPDAWEIENNLNPHDATGNNGWDGDPDGDGVINGDEWKYEFDPQNKTSPSAPSAPSFNNYGPKNAQAEIILYTPWLSVNNSNYNSTNVFYNNIKYRFEVYKDAALTQIFTSSDEFEGTNVTICLLTKDLIENTAYWWRSWSYIGNIKSAPMSTVSFFVNKYNEPPTQVNLSYPPDKSSVSSLSTKLEITNASDPDRDSIMYDFKLYNDNFLYETSGILEGISGVTSVKSPLLLDNTWYKWTARARDEHDSTGLWMDEAEFFVNTANDAPSAPEIISPVDDSEINSQSVEFAVKNALDLDGDKITYYFEADTTDSFNSNLLQKSDSISETSWQAINLADNTYWHWRIKSYDGSAASSWTNAGFFVNTTNDAPEIPVLLSPKETIAVTVTPELKIYPSGDIDGDALTYEYAVYDTARNKITGASGQGTSWIVDIPLPDNSKYFWHAAAFDEHGLGSVFSDTTWFFVNQGNDAPLAPKPVSPENESTIETQNPELEIENAKDSDGDVLTYHFQVFDNEMFLGNGIKEIEQIQEDLSGKTKYKIDINLPRDKKYFWRVRAYDGKTYGSWSETFKFIVKALPGDTGGIGEVKKGPCVITNIMNKTSHPGTIEYLNKYKDKYILKTGLGKWITEMYYKLSPKL